MSATLVGYKLSRYTLKSISHEKRKSIVTGPDGPKFTKHYTFVILELSKYHKSASTFPKASWLRSAATTAYSEMQGVYSVVTAQNLQSTKPL